MKRIAPTLALLPLLVLPCPLPASAAEVTGRVLDDQGRPIVNARVELVSPDEWHEQGLQGLIERRPGAVFATSDEHGVYRFEAPEDRPWSIRVSAPGRIPMKRPIRAFVDPVNLPPVTLRKDVGVRVTVEDSAGAPVTGAWVRYFTTGDTRKAWASGNPGWWPARPPLVTDERGRVRLSRFADESLLLTAWASGHLETRSTTDGKAIRLLLQPVAPRLLEVRDPRGEPVAGVLVRVHGSGWPAAVTDERGHVRVALGTDTATVGLSAADGRTARLRVAAGADPAGPETPAVVVLPDLWRLDGRVTDEQTGETLPGALVWADEGRRVTTAGERGEFSLLLPREGRTTHVFAIAPGHFADGRNLDTPPDTRPGLSATLALSPSAHVRGRVSDEAGAPLADAVVSWGYGPDPHNSLHVGPDGGFFIGPLKPGFDLYLRAERSGYAPTETTIPAGAGAEPQELVLRRGAEIRGRVVDDDGEPVSEARLTLHELDPDFASTSSRPAPNAPVAVSGVTGPDGRLRIPHIGPGVYGLAVEASGHAPAWLPRIAVEDGEPVELPDIVLEQGATVLGRVVDAGGSSLEGVLVVLGEDDDSAHLLAGLLQPEVPTWVRSTLTDAEGVFRFADIPPGIARSVAAHQAGYAPVVVPTRPVADEPPPPLELILQRAARVHGRVVDPRGRPLAAETVQVMLVNREGWRRTAPLLALETDAHGRFDRNDLPLGRLVLTLSTAPFGIPAAPSESRAEVDLVPGREIGPVLLVAAGTVQLTGRLRGVDGRPVAAVTVHLEGRWKTGLGPRAAISGVSGTFRFEDVPVGEYRLTAEHPEHGRADREVEVRAGDNRADLRFRASGRIDVRLTDEKTGEAVTEGWVRWENRDDPGDHDSTSVDSDGRAVIRPRGTGTYRLEVAANGYRTVTPPDVRITEHTHERLDVRLSSGVVVHGRVTGLDPVTLGRVRVKASLPESARSEHTTVTPDGRFELSGLEPGTWTVEATAATSQRRRESSLVVPEGRDEMSLVLDFGGDHTLTGVIRYNGEPVSGAALSVTSADGSTQAYDETDPRGRFRFEGLPTGAYHLAFGLAASLVEEREIDLVKDEELSLDLEGARVTGRVFDADGNPVERAQVALLGPDQPLIAMTMGFSAETTDTAGRFELSRMAAGPRRLHVRGPEGESLTMPVEVALPVTDLGDLVLEAGRRMALTFPAGGATPTEATVLVVDGAESVLVIEQQPVLQGRIELDVLPETSRSLVVQAEGYAPTRVALAPGVDTYPVELSPAVVLHLWVPALAADDEGTARYELTDATGEPPLYVRIFPQVREQLAVEDGRAEISFLRPGSWTVTVTAADGRSWSRTFTVHAGETTEVTME